MKECSYCNEPLNEDEITYFNSDKGWNETPLCSKCIASIPF
jgi:hypothetical protein